MYQLLDSTYYLPASYVSYDFDVRYTIDISKVSVSQ